MHEFCTEFLSRYLFVLDSLSPLVHSHRLMSDKLYDATGNITRESTLRPEDLADLVRLAPRLREFRLNSDLTFRKLAVLTDLSKSVLQRIEAGDTRLQARTVRKLKRFLEGARAA